MLSAAIVFLYPVIEVFVEFEARQRHALRPRGWTAAHDAGSLECSLHRLTTLQTLQEEEDVVDQSIGGKMGKTHSDHALGIRVV